MKRTDINPIFKLYDSIIYDDNIDYTRRQKITAYAASGNENIEKGQKLFDFDYAPILEDLDYEELLNFYDNSTLFVKLYKSVSFNYFTIYASCYKWYNENSKVPEAFVLQNQIKKYELKSIDDFCCPIIKYLDLELLDNINFFKNIKNNMSYAENKNIDSIIVLL